MSGGVDQVENVILAMKFILHLNGMTFNGNAALPLQIHIIQQLCLHITVCYRPRRLQQPVSQRALPMINMRYDAKISNVLHKE